jgi:1,2-diacylglycerol 3-alpha-glucosyltransferase
MRIGFFSDFYLPRADGIAYSIESFRIELEKMGHEVFIIAPKPTIRHNDHNKHIIRFPAIKGLFFDDYMTSFFFPPQRFRQIEKLKLDIVHFHTPGQIGLFGAYFAFRRDIPVVTTYHTDLYEYVTHYPKVLPGTIALSMLAPMITNGSMQDYRIGLSSIKPERNVDKWNQKIVERSSTLLHNRCDLIIAPSQKMKNQLVGWRTTSPIQVLPSGVDKITTKKAEIVSFRKQLHLNDDDEIILFVGRVGTEKNLGLLIKAFEIVNAKRPQTKLIIVGTGEDIDLFKNQAKATLRPEHILFTGNILREKLGGLYGVATVFAFPSLADTQGLVLSEAAWAGLPIVMIDKGISPVAVAGKNALFAKNNPKDFASKLLQVLTKPELRSAFSEASLTLAGEYTASKQSQALIQAYTETITRHKAGMETKKSLRDKFNPFA